MKISLMRSAFDKLYERFNLLVFLCFSLICSNGLLAYLVFHFSYYARTIIVPPVINEPITLDYKSVNISYLRQMSLFFINMRLTFTPKNIKNQHQFLLTMIDPSFYSYFYSSLSSEEDYVEKQKVSSVFYPQDFKVDVDQLVVLISGELQRFVAERAIKWVNKTYKISYKYNNGKLFVNEFLDIQENKNG